MTKVKIGDVIFKASEKVDKDNTDLEFYVAGEDFDCGTVLISKKSILKGSTIGPAFHIRFKPGDVLLMSRNPHLRKAAEVNFEGICSDVSYVCRTKDENILMQKYIKFIFQTDSFWKFAEAHKKGSTNFFLNWCDFAEYEFFLPSIEAQKEIVDKLEKIQSYKDSITDSLNNLENTMSAYFNEFYLKNEKVNLKKLNEVSDYYNGLTYSPDDVSESGMLVLRSSNILNDELVLEDNVFVDKNVSEKLIVHKNDILMCSRNGSANLVGKVAIIDKEYNDLTFGAFMMIFKTNLTEYLYSYFRSPFFKDFLTNGNTTTINQVTGKMLDTIQLPIPNAEEILNFNEVFCKYKELKSVLESKYTNAVKMLDTKINTLLKGE